MAAFWIGVACLVIGGIGFAINAGSIWGSDPGIAVGFLGSSIGSALATVGGLGWMASALLIAHRES